MPVDSPLKEKAEQAAGRPVQASARARLKTGDELLGANGVLCTVAGGLVFVEERLTGPGEATILERDSIAEIEVKKGVLGQDLVIKTEDRTLTFEKLDTGMADHLLSTAGLEKGLAPVPTGGPTAQDAEASTPAGVPPAESADHPARVEVEKDGWVETISWEELKARIRSGRYSHKTRFRPEGSSRDYALLGSHNVYRDNQPKDGETREARAREEEAARRERTRRARREKEEREKEEREKKEKERKEKEKREKEKRRKKKAARPPLTWFGTEDAIFTAGVNTRGFVVVGVNVSGVLAIGVNSIGVVAFGVNCLGGILSLGLNTASPLALLGLVVVSVMGPGSGWIAPKISVATWVIPVTTVVMAAVMTTVAVVILRKVKDEIDPDAAFIKKWQGWGFAAGAVISLLSNLMWLVEPKGPATVQEHLWNFLYGPGGWRP
jgi:hypothetical protein